ncbi:MAG: DUF3471 domain-containing protein, partial [Bacteroidota bacterium]|nr:DUF3471 domain-containing protein [Bacteroidota bacterium]
ASNQTLSDITKSIYAVLYGKEYELPKGRTMIMLPEETLKQYEGEYEVHPGFTVLMVAKDGELVATPTGQSPKVLHAEKEDFFFEKEEDVQLAFTRNDKKEVDGFILHQGGGQIKCKKIK